MIRHIFFAFVVILCALSDSLFLWAEDRDQMSANEQQNTIVDSQESHEAAEGSSQNEPLADSSTHDFDTLKEKDKIKDEEKFSSVKSPKPPSKPCWEWRPPKLCLYAGYTAGKGVGYPTGYGSLGIWAPSWNPLEEPFQPFVDVRGHLLNKGEKAANVGVGGRYYSECLNAAFGINSYWDFREGKHSNFNQIGIGVEILGAGWDFRFNGYIPVGKAQGSSFVVLEDSGTNFATLRYHKERALSGFDTEIGYYLMRKETCSLWDFDIYGALGPYYFSSGHGSNAFGGQGRLKATWMNFINLEVIASADEVYHGRVQCRFELCIPLGGNFWEQDGFLRCCGNDTSQDCFSQRVLRREIIATRNSSTKYRSYGSSSSQSESSESSH